MDTNRKVVLYIEIGRLVRSIAACANKDCEACTNAHKLKDQYNTELNTLRASA